MVEVHKLRAYHLLELVGLKELVHIGVNGEVKAGPRDYSRDS